MMFKVLVVQAANTLSDERSEFLINDRLSFMRFLGLGLSDRVRDARTIWLFGEKLTKAGAIKGLFGRFDAALRTAGYIAMSGQMVDTSLVAAPVDPDMDGHGRRGPRGRAATREPAAQHGPLSCGRTARTARPPRRTSWPGTASSAASIAFEPQSGSKPPGKPMPERTRRAHAKKSKVRSCIEHAFAEQKARMGLFVRPVGLAQATTKIGTANLVYKPQAGPLPGEAHPRRTGRGGSVHRRCLAFSVKHGLLCFRTPDP